MCYFSSVLIETDVLKGKTSINTVYKNKET